MKTEPTLNRIKDLMENGNWSDAIRLMKNLNCTAAEYQTYLDDIDEEEDIDILLDFALLGFYTKETIFD